MRILIVTQYFWPENFRINELSSEFIKSGNEVTILTGYPNYPEGFIHKDFKKNREKYSYFKGAKIIRVPLLPRGNNKITLVLNYITFCISASTWGLLKIAKFKFDIIFVFQTSPILVGIPSSIISYIKNIPQIIWILDLWPETLSAMGIKNKILISIIRNLSNIIYAQSKIILAQSKSFIFKLKKNIRKEKLIYFPAWSESGLSIKSKQKAKEVIPIKNIFTIMFAGNIGKAQDFPSILKTVQYLLKQSFNKFRIIIIGDGSMKDWLINEVRRKNLTNNVLILEKYPPDRMPSFFAHADALLVTLTDKELFKMTVPGKMQTYLASGIPILGMINGEAASVIKNSKAGYVCNSANFKRLGKLIIKMSKLSKKDRIKMGLNGKLYSKKNFDKNKLINRLEILMISLVNKNNL